MGITIHYDFGFEGSLGYLKDVFRDIRRHINDLNIVSISKVRIFDNARDCDNGWKERRGIGFEVNVMEGCEWFTCILFDRGDNLWTSHNFTKTEYCHNFEKGHKLVIEMLDVCKEHGILKRVSDEAGYWESRDNNLLAKNKQLSWGMIKEINNQLANSGLTVIRGDGVKFTPKKKEE